jgi:hypothetical protein
VQRELLGGFTNRRCGNPHLGANFFQLLQAHAPPVDPRHIAALLEFGGSL